MTNTAAELLKFRNIVVVEFDLTDPKYLEKCFLCGTTMTFDAAEDKNTEVITDKVHCVGCVIHRFESRTAVRARWGPQVTSKQQIWLGMWKQLWLDLQEMCQKADKVPKWLQGEYESAGSY